MSRLRCPLVGDDQVELAFRILSETRHYGKPGFDFHRSLPREKRAAFAAALFRQLPASEKTTVEFSFLESCLPTHDEHGAAQ